MIKLTTEEILRLDEVNSYVVKQLSELYKTVIKFRVKLNNGEKVYASDMGYLMTAIESIYELMSRDLDNSEANGTAKGKSLSTKEEI
jgi:hypothetical protein